MSAVTKPSEICPLAKSAFCVLNTDLHVGYGQTVVIELSGIDIDSHEGSELPPTVTWPTPLICESFCDITVEASSYSLPVSYFLEVRPMIMIGESAGFTSDRWDCRADLPADRFGLR